MTFTKSAWAIDGALMDSSLARSLAYASMGGAQGIVRPNDLKVIPLGTPGNGVQITAGSGIVLNRYQGTAVNESYTVTNPSTHTLTSIPAATATETAYVVGVVVGDPDFSQAGHPFMPSTIPTNQQSGYTYVRPMMLPFSAFGGGGVETQKWPFLPLALVIRRANTSTITAGDIFDMRYMARERQKLEMNVAANLTTEQTITGSTTYAHFPNVIALECQIPEWATVCKINAFLEGARLMKAGQGNLAIQGLVNGTTYLTTTATNIVELTPGSVGERRTYHVAGEINVAAYRGQNIRFYMRGNTANAASAAFLKSDQYSSVMCQAYFEELPD